MVLLPRCFFFWGGVNLAVRSTIFVDGNCSSFMPGHSVIQGMDQQTPQHRWLVVSNYWWFPICCILYPQSVGSSAAMRLRLRGLDTTLGWTIFFCTPCLAAGRFWILFVGGIWRYLQWSHHCCNLEIQHRSGISPFWSRSIIDKHVQISLAMFQWLCLKTLSSQHDKCRRQVCCA